VIKNNTTSDALVERFCWVLKRKKSWHIRYFLLYGFWHKVKNWNTDVALMMIQYTGEMYFFPQPHI